MKYACLGLAALAASLTGCGGSATPSANVAEAASGMDSALWPQFYQRAGALFEQGRRDDSVALFYIGQLRGRIRIQCVPGPPDREPALFASLQETIGQTVNEYAGGDPAGWAASIQQALAWDEAHPDPNSPGDACRAERVRQRQGLGELRQHVMSSADQIRRERAANGLPNR